LIVLIDLNDLAVGMKFCDCNPIGKGRVVVQRWRNLNAKRGQTGEIVRERVKGRHVWKGAEPGVGRAGRVRNSNYGARLISRGFVA
jgi:hypothetical protein